MPSKIIILNYGLANLRSVQKAFEHIGHSAEITSDPNIAAEATKLVLPGVGAFRDAIAGMHSTALGDVVKNHIQAGKPFFGICLGLQLLFTRSTEDGLYDGLNIFPGDVVRFPEQPGLKVPHMGWNPLKVTQPNCPMFAGLPTGAAVYFVHSYYPAPEERDLVSATADYPTPFCAAICRDNVWATQFHPEKSQAVGMQILRNFAER